MSTFFWHQNIVLACLSCVLPSGANTIIAQFGPHLLPLIILKGLYWIFCYLYILFVGLRQAGGNNTRWHEFRWTGGILIPPFWETTLIRQKDCWFHFPLRWQWRIWCQNKDKRNQKSLEAQRRQGLWQIALTRAKTSPKTWLRPGEKDEKAHSLRLRGRQLWRIGSICAKNRRRARFSKCFPLSNEQPAD